MKATLKKDNLIVKAETKLEAIKLKKWMDKFTDEKGKFDLSTITFDYSLTNKQSNNI